MEDANDSVNHAETQDGSSGSQDAEHQHQSQDTVKYETYRKVLSEKKRRDEEVRELREQVQAFESANKQAQEKDLEEQNKWKEIADLRSQELEQTKQDLDSMKESQRQAMKLDSFLSALGTNLPREYWDLIKLGEVKINPDSNEVDEMSVTAAVEKFRKTYPRVLQDKQAASTPNTAPRGTAAATRGEKDWDKLSRKDRNKMLGADLISLQKTRRSSS